MRGAQIRVESESKRADPEPAAAASNLTFIRHVFGLLPKLFL